MTRVPIPTACARLTGGRSLQPVIIDHCSYNYNNNKSNNKDVGANRTLGRVPSLNCLLPLAFSRDKFEEKLSSNSCWLWLRVLNCQIIVCIIYAISVSYLLGYIHGIMTINFDLIKTTKLTLDPRLSKLVGPKPKQFGSIKANKSLQGCSWHCVCFIWIFNALYLLTIIYVSLGIAKFTNFVAAHKFKQSRRQ